MTQSEWRNRILSPTLTAASSATTHMLPIATHDSINSIELLTYIISSLDNEKAEEIVQIDLRGKSSIGDYMVIASGRSSRQVTSISDKLTDRLKADCGVLCKIEGKENGDWVLIDAGDVIVHIFRPEVREFYQLEKMWLPTNAPSQ